MTPAAEPTDALVDRVLATFDSGRSRWRTAGGIARQLGIPLRTVDRLLAEHPDRFERAAEPLAGIAVHGLRCRTPATSSVGD